MNVPLINGAAVTLKVGKKELKLSFNTEKNKTELYIHPVAAVADCSDSGMQQQQQQVCSR